MAKPFFTYMLLCGDGSYYVRHSDHLEKRLAEHQFGGKCIYTSARQPVKLVWSQYYPTRLQAIEMEKRVKTWNRAKKAALSRGDFDTLVLASKKKGWEQYRERVEAKQGQD